VININLSFTFTCYFLSLAISALLPGYLVEPHKELIWLCDGHATCVLAWRHGRHCWNHTRWDFPTLQSPG